jgi:hypothetical protein
MYAIFLQATFHEGNKCLLLQEQPEINFIRFSGKYVTPLMCMYRSRIVDFGNKRCDQLHGPAALPPGKETPVPLG